MNTTSLTSNLIPISLGNGKGLELLVIVYGDNKDLDFVRSNIPQKNHHHHHHLIVYIKYFAIFTAVF